jgi:hypothetical protein
MSQFYIPSLYVVHFKGALNPDEAEYPSTGILDRNNFRVPVINRQAS